MICRGHVPIRGNPGDRIAPVNKDVKPFLLYFLPKGQSLNWRTMNQIVKQFHLAFKGMETEEVYDVLMEQLVGRVGEGATRWRDPLSPRRTGGADFPRPALLRTLASGMRILRQKNEPQLLQVRVPRHPLRRPIRPLAASL